MKRHRLDKNKLSPSAKWKGEPKPPSIAKAAERPKHKEALRLNAAMIAQNKAHPEPMSLIHKRQKLLDQGLFDPQREVTNGAAEKVARAVADWELSDPFAYGRTFLHAKRGLLDPTKLSEEMHLRTVARRAAKIKEVNDAKSRAEG